MNNDNPAEMSNVDLEKDTQLRSAENKSTAAEGTLKTPAEDQSSVIHHHTAFNASEEQDGDDLVHAQGAEHNGTMPDPESVSNWEDRDTNDKMSG